MSQAREAVCDLLDQFASFTDLATIHCGEFARPLSDLRLHFQCRPQVLIFEQVFVPDFTFQTFC